MKLPQLSYFFPANSALAELYGGWLEGPYFKKIFRHKSIDKRIDLANEFLKENGFNVQVTFNDFIDRHFEDGCLILSFDTMGNNMLVLIYEQPVMTQPLDSIVELIEQFRTERNWKQFHDPKNLAIALSIESGELLDLFLWDRYKNPDIEKIKNEVADIFVYLLLLSKELNIDLLEAAVRKIEMNSKKYPVDKAKGSAKKYNEL
jgi:NTP pyrophosphatase (non-canonical NTP hydrolase)